MSDIVKYNKALAVTEKEDNFLQSLMIKHSFTDDEQHLLSSILDKLSKAKIKPVKYHMVKML